VSQSNESDIDGHPYSKSLALPACGIVPRLAILANAGGWPVRGGGVVLPSNGRFARAWIFVNKASGAAFGGRTLKRLWLEVYLEDWTYQKHLGRPCLRDFAQTWGKGIVRFHLI
jgi:hypothetical protein